MRRVSFHLNHIVEVVRGYEWNLQGWSDLLLSELLSVALTKDSDISKLVSPQDDAFDHMYRQVSQVYQIFGHLINQCLKASLSP